MKEIILIKNPPIWFIIYHTQEIYSQIAKATLFPSSIGINEPLSSPKFLNILFKI